jgi:5-methylcytosine-specific restriction protein B
LVDNRKHDLINWYNSYVSFTNDVQQIKNALTNSIPITSKDCYKNTQYYNAEDSYKAFVKHLLYDQSNGISGRGRSVLSDNNLNAFINNGARFETVLTNLILAPNKDSNEAFREFWLEIVGNNNPVLTNRALATCTLGVSSTVDEGKFNQVFEWLENNGFIQKYPTDKPNDWYHKNIHAIEEVKLALTEVKDVDSYWISLFFWEMYVNLANPFSLKKQIVKYGAPGTGKTFKAKQISKLQFDIWKSTCSSNSIVFDDVTEVIQFHPSYSYEDFIEGLRPILDENNKAQLTLQNGVFKNFCIKAGCWEVDVYNLKLNKDWIKLDISDIEPYKNTLTGKHWDYIFNMEDKTQKLKEIVPPHFIIIDEINRAELSRVFGELMFCLEYRGVEGKVKTQYVELNSEKTGMLKIRDSFQFFVPHNVHILATMNTIDRSVESFDFALRRRFKWEEVEPDINLLRYHLQEYNSRWIDLANSLESLNDVIRSEPILGKDYCIGHAYLWNLPYPKDLPVSELRKIIWEDSIESLIEEYLRGSGRIDLLLTLSKSFGIN